METRTRVGTDGPPPPARPGSARGRGGARALLLHSSAGSDLALPTL